MWAKILRMCPSDTTAPNFVAWIQGIACHHGGRFLYHEGVTEPFVERTLHQDCGNRTGRFGLGWRKNCAG